MRGENDRRDDIPRRCAWCERFFVDGKWIAGRRDADVVNAHGARMTHTICDDCTALLRVRESSV